MVVGVAPRRFFAQLDGDVKKETLKALLDENQQSWQGVMKHMMKSVSHHALTDMVVRVRHPTPFHPPPQPQHRPWAYTAHLHHSQPCGSGRAPTGRRHALNGTFGSKRNHARARSCSLVCCDDVAAWQTMQAKPDYSAGDMVKLVTNIVHRQKHGGGIQRKAGYQSITGVEPGSTVDTILQMMGQLTQEELASLLKELFATMSPQQRQEHFR